MALFYYKYNNYNNRRLKREDTLQGYSDYLVYTEVNPNFNPGDGVSTQITVGRDQNAYVSNADYVIYSETGTNITSRWFIMESSFNRSGQYVINLYRDMVADFYNEILNADTFIEKATLPDSSPLIFNKENIGVNQIKKHEELIKDESGCAWIVGYVDRKYEGGKVELTSPEVIPDITVDDLEQWQYYKYTTVSLLKERCYGYIANDSFDFEVIIQAGGNSLYKVVKDWSLKIDMTDTATFLPATTFVTTGGKLNEFVANKKDIVNQTVNQYKNLYYTTVTKPGDYNAIKELNGKFIYDKASQNYFKISVNYGTEDQSKPITEDKQGEYLYTWLRGQFADIHATGSGNPSYRLNVSYAYVTIQLQKITGTIATHVITMPSPANRLHCKDAPFDMFCIPFGDNIGISNSVNPLETPVDTNSTGYLALSQSLAQQLGVNLYDLQLLPFCPATGLNYYKTADGKKYIDLNTGNSQRYTFATTSDYKNYMPLIWCTASSGNLTTATYCGPRGYRNKKVDNECKMYRIVSGNYSATFEYNPEKFMTNAEGAFTGLNVDFTYLPYQPFIRIAPKFTGLYGSEYHDARGLILSGDFSLMYLSDAWVNYQTQNKNYQQIFNREIQSMEFQNNITNQNNRIQAIVGALSGATTGALAGASVGGVAGGIAGGLVGGAASAIGGYQDIKNTKALQAEAIDYKQDLFGYQLGNVKALPNSIAKSTAYNIINKVFPIIEFYDCTEEERTIVAKKIAWNGMTVMAIGRIADYINNSWTCQINDNTFINDKGYIKGQLIRLESDNIDDAHLQATIIEEINKGWYFK